MLFKTSCSVRFELIEPGVFYGALLIAVFLKTKGLDPSKHPVSEELKRVKSYFDKIRAAENPVTRMRYLPIFLQPTSD